MCFSVGFLIGILLELPYNQLVMSLTLSSLVLKSQLLTYLTSEVHVVQPSVKNEQTKKYRITAIMLINPQEHFWWYENIQIYLAKRVTDRGRGAERRVLRGAKRRVSIRGRAERAKARAGGCESRSVFFYIFIYLDGSTALNNGADVT